MRRPPRIGLDMRLAPAALAVAAAGLVLWAEPALAANGPFGIAPPDAPGASAWGGPLGPLFAWIAAWQSSFYRSLTGALGELRQNGGAFVVLGAVSFAYGVFHAIGPGHGKAVVTSYVLASGQTLRRGIVVSFAAAFVQALTAIVLVTIAVLILNATAVTMTAATNILEIGSYALITAVGAWLLWSRATGRGHGHHHHAAASDDGQRHGADCDHCNPAFRDLRLERGQRRPQALGAAVAIAPAEPQVHHSHSHAPDPALLRRPLTLGSAWAAILAVGIRPCSGAIIVLVFAFAQGLYAAGAAATLLMALGTGLTVSALAALAVGAKDLAVRLAGEGSGRARTLYRVIEIGAAAAVLLFGLLLLGGALSGGSAG